MSEYDIHERIFQFILQVLRALNKIPKTTTNLVIINQISRSVTSMGANDQEADGTLTKKDFIHKFSLVKKEGKETVFWLRLLSELNHNNRIELNKSLTEGQEIVAIVSKILINSNKK